MAEKAIPLRATTPRTRPKTKGSAWLATLYALPDFLLAGALIVLTYAGLTNAIWAQQLSYNCQWWFAFEFLFVLGTLTAGGLLSMTSDEQPVEKTISPIYLIAIVMMCLFLGWVTTQQMFGGLSLFYVFGTFLAVRLSQLLFVRKITPIAYIGHLVSYLGITLIPIMFFGLLHYKVIEAWLELNSYIVPYQFYVVWRYTSIGIAFYLFMGVCHFLEIYRPQYVRLEWWLNRPIFRGRQ